MRAFIFAIGGTGARVLNALIMQLAAGAQPKDQDGNLITSIVPIIIDPHATNDALTKSTSLLHLYKSIRQTIYRDNESTEGFFGTKIETLHDINRDNNNIADQFYFQLNNVTNNTFSNFIQENNITDASTLHFINTLYSRQEKGTNMNIGFEGSPNIGSVALSEFSKSHDFEAFRNVYQEGDKLFFIGSIFGGTGAAGLPLFISKIRDLAHRQNNDNHNIDCAHAPIGALIVMPYFSITYNNDSSINQEDWLPKVRSALDYYDQHLNNKINDIYYLADPQMTTPFFNDAGQNSQSGNRAHLVEFVGANAFFHFIQSNNVTTNGNDIVTATQTKYYRYDLNNANLTVTFNEFPQQTNDTLQRHLMAFHILRNFMISLPQLLDRPFACKYAPKIEGNILSQDIKNFWNKYDDWLNQMKNHGVNAHNLDLFAECQHGNYTDLFNGVDTKQGIIFKKTKKTVDNSVIIRKLNEVAEQHNQYANQYSRWFNIAFKAINEVIEENYNLGNNQNR